MASSTSPLVIFPFGPVPVSDPKSTPFASANLRAVGVAAGSSLVAVDFGAGVSAVAGAGDVDGAALRSPTSSPSSASIAISAPTATFSVPSLTRMAAMTPSSTASNSIVALSVSISAIISPEDTVSPTLTSHLASVPSSIVGDSAGILIAMGIAEEFP